MKTDYEKQAEKFLADTNSTLTIEFLKNDYHFDGDKDKRDIYTCTLKRGSRKYKFNFGQSIAKSGFYFTVGRSKFEIDRKHIDSKYIFSICRNINAGFELSKDTIHKPEEPTAYDILACLTKFNPYTFEDFCSEYGYDTDSRRAKKTYKAVQKEYNSLAAMYSDSEMELMAEIQ